MTNRSPRLVSTGVAAERANVRPQTIRNWVEKGLLPAARIGRNIRIDLNDLDALAQPRMKPEPPRPVDVSLPAREAFAEYIARVVAEAPPLTSDQVAKISTLLGSKAVA
ncbi:helix-turn-helix domain-containing protein [Nocardia puris]|uniref:helix-turn-helix domain-containing protein n=1 Tax=Nocardia puris TaxID=208602 RepID=UPI0018938F40|nr:helix-turn-helix domain-containing protein [Nocardia puris]MBF6460295.1 helix-turn-helix domain-containing protein [Nocardia puris]